MKHVIECTNCGSGGTDPQFYITLGALVIAVAALVMNFFQFREFMRQTRAHAEFKIEFRTIGADDDGTFRTDEARCTVRVEASIRNTGRKAASRTLVNIRIPRDIDTLRWCDVWGNDVEGDFGSGEESEPLLGPDGREVPAIWESCATDNFGRGLNRPVYFELYTEVPNDGEILIPIELAVHADEIPEDISKYEARHIVRVERRDPLPV